jgi:TrpR-related protein YerC/YecD
VRHMSKASDKVNSQELYRAILSLQSEEECRRFFKDLCTISELRAMEQRYDVAVLLDQGMVYSDILEATGASSATISRVNRALNYGENGYKDILSRMKEQK